MRSRALLLVLCLSACDRSASSAVKRAWDARQTLASADPTGASPSATAASRGQTPASSAPAPASPSPPPAVDPDPVGPLDARPFIAEAHARYPDAKAVTVEGNAVVLVAMNDARLLPSAARFTRRVLLSYTHDRFGRFPSVPVYVLLFSTFDAFDHFSRTHYGVPGKENLGGYDAKTRQILVDASNGEKSLPTIVHELVHCIMREADFPRAPEWFSECMATVFESPRWADDASRFRSSTCVRPPCATSRSPSVRRHALPAGYNLSERP